MAAFVGAIVLLAVTPVPGVLYVVTSCLSQGRASGLAFAAGVAAGSFGNALASTWSICARFAWQPAPSAERVELDGDGRSLGLS